jgi:UDP-3-O-[3-hydroxymyristoyl] glucosamine N-acyltransferase
VFREEVAVMSAGISLGELAVRFGCTLQGDPDAVVSRVGTLEGAGADAVAFLANPKYRRFLADTKAGAVVVDPAVAAECRVPALLHKNPYATYARIASILHPPARVPSGIHPSAVIDPTAVIDASASVGPLCVIEARAHIGARAVIGPNCVIKADASVGADTRLSASIALCEGVIIGERCLLHPGVIIGADGFGFAPDRGDWVKVPQVGSVRIGSDVEIGANTTIDRGAIEDTVIEDGVKLDNQIQIGHNVRVGSHTVIAACTGISGSTTIGKRCLIGGLVGMAGHITIGDDVVVAGKSAVSNSIDKPGMYSNVLMLEEASKWRRNAVRVKQLDDLAKTVKQLSRSTGDKTDAGE